jgi:hypothetical protein
MVVQPLTGCDTTYIKDLGYVTRLDSGTDGLLEH